MGWREDGREGWRGREGGGKEEGEGEVRERGLDHLANIPTSCGVVPER